MQVLTGSVTLAMLLDFSVSWGLVCNLGIIRASVSLSCRRVK